MNEQANLPRYSLQVSERAYLSIAFFLTSVLGGILAISAQEVSTAVLIWQAVTSFAFCYSLYISRGWNVSITLGYIFAYQLFFSYVLQGIFRAEGVSVFGYQPVDALLYDKIAQACYRSSLIETIGYIRHYLSSLSDLGFPIYMKYIYELAGGAEGGVVLLVFCNVIAQVLTTWILYRLGVILLNSREYSVLLAILWGCNTASTYYSVAGLKEPLFTLLCTVAIYFFYKIRENKRRWRYHMAFLLGVAAICFLRYYMSLFFLIIYIGFVFFDRLAIQYFKSMSIVAVLLCLVFTNVLANYFVEIKYAMLATETLFGGQGVLFKLVSYLLSIVSPIPRFINMEYSGDLLVVAFSIVKFFCALYALGGVYRIIKMQQVQFYPLISILLFTTLLLIVSGHMLDYRYGYIVFPCFYLLAVYGMKQMRISRPVMLSFFVGAMLLMIVFNSRML